MIRRALEKDIERIDHLLYQVNQVHADGRPDIFISGKKKYTDKELLSLLKEDNNPIFVYADETDTVLGYAFCITEEVKNCENMHDMRTLYIDDLCVDELMRGKHIGTKLYEYVLDYAKNHGYNRVTLNVWNLNAPAMAFYQKCGLSPLKITMEQVL